jgi:hypothetical protein
MTTTTTVTEAAKDSGKFHDQGDNVKQGGYLTPGAKQLRRNQFST